MKTAVIYLTKTGHSKKIATAIGKELQIAAEDIKTKPQLTDVDLLFIVGGIYGGKSLPELLSYLQSIDNNRVKKVALVTSCVSKIKKQEEVRAVLTSKNIAVLPEEFICQGNFLFFGFGRPNKEDLANAATYAKDVANREQC